MQEEQPSGGPARTAVVTGGAGGIGAAIAARLVSSGARVFLLDRDEVALGRTADLLGATAVPCDVASDSSVATAIEVVAATSTAVDALVNAAGVADGRDLESLDGPSLDRVLAVNLGGPVRVTRAALSLLRRSPAPRVLNIGSIQAERAAAGTLAYVASKGGVHAVTRALAVDLAPDGVLVNALAPGFVDTAMALLPDGTSEYDTAWFRDVYLTHGRIPLRRPGRPEEVAAAADFFLSAANTYVTGAVLAVDGGLGATF